MRCAGTTSLAFQGSSTSYSLTSSRCVCKQLCFVGKELSSKARALLPVCLTVCLCVCMSVCLYVCMSVCLYVCLSVCLSVRPSVCPFVCPSVRQCEFFSPRLSSLTAASLKGSSAEARSV